MKIICHRGVWKTIAEQNTIKSIKGSFDFDGVEIDLRSRDGRIYLSHDPLRSKKKYSSLEEAFKLKGPTNFFWALNIKEDGMADQLRRLLQKYQIRNYMCFDLSFPEQVSYQKRNLKVYSRTGDLEPGVLSRELVFDCFSQANFASSLKKIPQKSEVFVISPELHHENHLNAWKVLKKARFSELQLCTDLPVDARNFFKDLI